MRRFAANASGVSNSPHTLANWHVVKDVSSLLTVNVAMPDLEYLSKIEGKSISQAARSLLQLHDETLANHSRQHSRIRKNAAVRCVSS